MKYLALIPIIFLVSCAYDGPMISVSAGFNGISAGVSFCGGAVVPKAVELPKPSGK